MPDGASQEKKSFNWVIVVDEILLVGLTIAWFFCLFFGGMRIRVSRPCPSCPHFCCYSLTRPGCFPTSLNQNPTGT